MLATMFLFAIAFFAIAYMTYGMWLKKLFALDPNKETPATCLYDGIDYCPTHPAVLMGHHFASIAGAGPIVGPIAAASMFGWLPTYIWILVGSVFFGGVHDMGSLVASLRHKGLSVGEVVFEWIGHPAKKLFLVFTWLALTLVIAVFLELSAQTFAADPAVAFSAIVYMVIAMIFGWLVYRLGLNLLYSTIVMVPLVIGSIFYGNSSPWVLSTFKFSVEFWRWALVVYIFAASVLPVWLLLQPRDYLASFLLYFSVAIGAIGMLFLGNVDTTKIPMYSGFSPKDGQYLWPMLFITVACGAISGFHSLVGSGTTSKQMRKETDALPVGYGAMLIEGVVAVIALGTLIMAGGMMKGGPTVVYGAGIGKMAGLIGIDPKVGTSLGLLALNSFLLTSLDTATRIARYQFQELTGNRLDKYSATAVGVAIALVLLFWKTGNTPAWVLIWPVFGAANQLVAAMALLAIGVWVIRCLKKPANFIMIPMLFMLITTFAGLGLLIVDNLKKQPLLAIISAILLIMAFVLVKMAWGALNKPTDDLCKVD